jgi:hypothetical protein
MANQIINDPKDYSEVLRLIETTDPNHADTFNPLFKRLLDNSAFLKAAQDALKLATDTHAVDPAKHISDAERTAWNAKETPTGAQQKIDAALAALIEGAPGALDTLNELAAAMGDDPNFAATVINRIAAAEQDATTHKADYTQHKETVATELDYGHVKVGDGISVDNGTISTKIGIVDVNNEEFVPEMEVDILETTDVSADFPTYDTYTDDVGNFTSIVEDGDFIYAASQSTTKGIVKLSKSDMSLVAANYTINEIRTLFVDDLYIYAIPMYSPSVTANQVIRKLNKSDLSLVATSVVDFRWVRNAAMDNDFIYVCGHGTLLGYKKINKSNLVVVGENKTLDTEWWTIVVDATHLYITHGAVAGAYNTARTVKIDKVTLAQVAQSATSYSRDTKIIDMDANFLIAAIYPNSTTTGDVYALLRKSDLLIERQILQSSAPAIFDLNIAKYKDGFIYSTVSSTEVIKVAVADWSLALRRTGLSCQSITVIQDRVYLGVLTGTTPSISRTEDIAGRPTLQEPYYNGSGYVLTNPGHELKRVTYRIKQILRRVITG